MNKLLAALKPFISLLLFAIPIAVGAAFLIWAATNRKTPEKLSEKEVARTLRFIKVEPTAVVPIAIGYGESAASNSFQAVAEVKGRIIDLHPELKSGIFVRKGELLVSIDKTDVEITIQKLQAEIARSEASVQELQATQKNLESGISIELSSLKLAKRELDRLQNLYNQNRSISASELDDQRRNVLAQQQSVQNLQNSLNLLPSQIKSAEASIAVSKANLASSERDLDRCTIIAPFNCRLGSVDLEIDEVVSVGQQLLSAQSIDKLEIEAQFGLDKVANLIRPDSKSPGIARDLAANPQELIRKFFDVEVTIRYGAGDVRTSRDARFERLREQLDAQARTIGIVASIDRPFEGGGNARNEGPPPMPGTYCEVELRGKTLEGAFVVPRSAIRQDVVYLVDSENRLRKREVKILFAQANFAAVLGLLPGERVIVSDPTPAIEGMLVNPQVDSELAATLQAEAGAEK